MSTRLTQRQYQTPERELARQLQERDRESFSELRALYSSISNLSVKVSSLWVFPEDFGAKRDGKTDDSRAIQDAVTYAESRGGAVWLRLGVYRISSTIVIRDTVRIFGDAGAVLLQAGTNLTHIRFASSVADVTIDGFEIRGNQTGLGGTVTGGLGGHGIALNGAIRPTISHMRFANIGVPVATSVHGNYASPVTGSSDLGTFFDNYFADSCHNRTGSDIGVIGLGNKFLFNKSESDCDACISAGGGGAGALIIGNWAKRLPGTTARSGVIPEYGENTTDARIVGNYMRGFAWHGFYTTTSSDDSPGDEFGGIEFSNNTAIYCGGGRTGDTSFITSSFRFSGRRGISGTGNKALYDGYDETGTPRAVLETAGILFLDTAANVTMSDTVIRHAYERGVLMRALNPGRLIENIQFSNLQVLETVSSHGFHVNAQVAGAECIRNIKVHTGRITVTDATASGVICDEDNGSWFTNVTFDNVDVEHLDPPASGSVAGFHWDGYSDFTRNTGRISNCLSKGFRDGYRCAYTVNMFVPFALRMTNNRVENANLGFSIGGGSLYWGIHEGSTGSNVTTMSPSRARSGRIIGPAAAGRQPVEVNQVNLINAVPVDGAWVAGDRMYMAAKAGPIVGYECTASGSIGTWRPIYNYGFGGEILRLGTTPIVNSTTPTLDGMSAWTATGTATAAAYANTSRYTRTTRLEVLQTVASASNVAGYQNADLGWLLNTGFYVRFQWGLATGVATTTMRAFAGLAASTAAPTDVEPSSLVDMVGMGWDAADTNVQILRNDGSGTATKVDLGSSFPVPTTDATQVYTLELIGASTGIQYSVTNETTGVSARGSFSTDLPNGGTAPLAPQIWASVGGTSSVAGIAFAGFYGERAF